MLLDFQQAHPFGHTVYLLSFKLEHRNICFDQNDASFMYFHMYCCAPNTMIIFYALKY